MVFDGDCDFCSLWIRRWQQMTGAEVDYLPAQDPRVRTQFPEIPREQFDVSVQLIETDGWVYSGAEAVFRAMAHAPHRRWPLRAYQFSPAVARTAEMAYLVVASHRGFFSLLTRWLWGRHVEQPTQVLARWLFLRVLGAIYLLAFLSLGTQVGGLLGHNGILPVDRFIAAVAKEYDLHGIGLDRFRLLPTLSWINSSDAFLHWQCAAGAVLAIALIVGVAPVPCLVLLWMLYLSLAVVGREFLGFQWDNLLLETGFLAIFFAPWQMWPRASRATPPSRLALWLLRLLLFKLMFSSGCVKLSSGDPNWRNLSALSFHYQTQPLPTWLAWYANQWPLGWHKVSCAFVFVVELAVPFLIFAPRRLRLLGCFLLVGLQILIVFTGNYTFFNLLTLALCLLLVDDFSLRRLLPLQLSGFLGGTGQLRDAGKRRWHHGATLCVALVFVPISCLHISRSLGVGSRWLSPLGVVDDWLSPFRTISGYGLFAVMTTERREIIVEGSDDRASWLPYEFKYKPGDVNRRPGWVAPHQPRLDWQMWFAALGSYRNNRWFVNFCIRLLQGSPDVLGLLAKNPFPEHPPRYLRAESYRYDFTESAERRATGAWWKRERVGEYLPPISLAELAARGFSGANGLAHAAA
jgi:predicted DCC family thiol-disulfide oxidoreductase YuxK